MSSVPSQGVNIEPKKRGNRGELGEGTPGKRVKAGWRAAQRLKDGTNPFSGPLIAYARWLAKSGDEDSKTWLSSKRHGGSDEQRKERKLRRKEKQSANVAARLERRGKGKQKKAA